MLPTVTIVMMNLGFVMSGAILAENMFNWPGLGLLSYDSMQKRDYPVMQAVFLIASIAVIVADLIADVMYLPRPKGAGMISRRFRNWIIFWTIITWSCSSCSRIQRQCPSPPASPR